MVIFNELVIRKKYRTIIKLTFSKSDLVNEMSLYDFCYVSYAYARQCTDLKKTRNDIEKDSENTGH